MAAPLLGREAILAATDLTTEDIAVPEWGGTVRVKMLMADERTAFEKACQVKKRGPNNTITVEPNDKINVRAVLVAKVIVDETGAVLFPDANDVVLLGRKSSAALERVFEVACRMNGIGERDVEELEGQEKNS